MNHRAYDVITFDCYGTLIDWESGIVNAFATEANQRGVGGVDPASLMELYVQTEARVESEEFMRYRDVLATTAARVAERLGWPAGDDAFLAKSLASWHPFPDTNPALAALKSRGYRLGILSNVDRDLLEETQRHFAVPFDFVVTAGDVRSYKPAEGHFRAGMERASGSQWLHAAQSWFHDVVPARRMGIPVVWVNRKGELLGSEARPAGVVRDMAGLVAWLET
jgi:2-haloalkanoic acid dehalogenase type II